MLIGEIEQKTNIRCEKVPDSETYFIAIVMVVTIVKMFFYRMVIGKQIHVNLMK